MSSGVPAAPPLRLEELSVPRGDRTVVRDVSLEVAPAEVTTLLGANGAGKSTLVLAIAGVLRPSGGRVLLGDLDLTRRRPEKIRASGQPFPFTWPITCFAQATAAGVPGSWTYILWAASTPAW